MGGFSWGQVVDWYREPLFWQFPVASVLISTLSFAVFAGPLTWMAAVTPFAEAIEPNLAERHPWVAEQV